MNDDKKAALKKAPPPITPPVFFSPKPPKFDTDVKGPPNWKHWRHVSTIEIWQGLMLSLNIEPPGKGWLLDNKPGITGNIPYEYLDNRGLTVEFKRRWCLVKNRLETRYAAAGILQNAELTNFLRLPLFAALAVEFEWGEMPPELVALAKDAQQAAPAVKDEAAPVATPTPTAKDGTNKKKWDDARLRALWEESIMPGVTQTSLAKKHGVKRQRIATLINTAKEKFSTRASSHQKNPWEQTIR